MNRLRERGFTAIEVIGILVLIGAVVAAGWFVYDRMQDKNKDSTANTSQQESADSDAPAVNNAKDLDTATKTLDDTNLDTSTTDSSDLDSELSAF